MSYYYPISLMLQVHIYRITQSAAPVALQIVSLWTRLFYCFSLSLLHSHNNKNWLGASIYDTYWCLWDVNTGIACGFSGHDRVFVHSSQKTSYRYCSSWLYKIYLRACTTSNKYTITLSTSLNIWSSYSVCALYVVMMQYVINDIENINFLLCL